MADILKGVIYKKTTDENGNVTGKVPFLPKSLAKFIVRGNGETVEKTLQDLESKKSYMVYDTMEDYETAKDAGEIPNGVLSIIKDA